MYNYKNIFKPLKFLNISFKKGQNFSVFLDYAAVVVLALTFVLAVMDAQFPLVTESGKGGLKWVVFLLFGFYCISKYRGKIVKIERISLLFVIFVGVVTLSTLYSSSDLKEGILRTISFWVLWSIAFVFPTPINPLNRIILWSNILIALSAIITIVCLFSLPLPFAVVGGRLKGITSNANTLGSFAAICSIAGLSYFFSFKRRLFGLLLTGVGLTCLFLSGSRSSMLASFVSICLLSAIQGKSKMLFKKIIILSLSAIIFIGAYHYFDQLKMNSTLYVKRQWDLHSRELIIRSQLEAWIRSPLIGNGLVKPGKIGEEGRPGGESSFIDLLAVSGILGAGPLFAGLTMGCYTFFKIATVHRHNQPVKISYIAQALSIVTCIIVNSVGEGYMAAVGSILPIYVWIMCGVASHIKILRNKSLRQ